MPRLCARLGKSVSPCRVSDGGWLHNYIRPSVLAQNEALCDLSRYPCGALSNDWLMIGSADRLLTSLPPSIPLAVQLCLIYLSLVHLGPMRAHIGKAVTQWNKKGIRVERIIKRRNTLDTGYWLLLVSVCDCSIVAVDHGYCDTPLCR